MQSRRRVVAGTVAIVLVLVSAERLHRLRKRTSKRRSNRWSIAIGILGFIAGSISTMISLVPFASGVDPRGVSGDISTLGPLTGGATWGLDYDDEDGQIAVADGSSLRIFEARGGNYVLYENRFAGRPNLIRDLAFERGGSIVFSDDSGRVQRYSHGEVTTLAGNGSNERSDPPDGGAAGNTPLNSPRGVGALDDGRVFFCDMLNDRVRYITPDGEIFTFSEGVDSPNDMAVSPTGEIYVATYEGKVLRTNFDTGRFEEVFDIRSTRERDEQQQLGFVVLSFAPSGDLLVLDELGSRAWRVQDGKAVLLLGTGKNIKSPDGVPAKHANLNFPTALTATSDYRIVIAEAGSLRVAQMDG